MLPDFAAQLIVDVGQLGGADLEDLLSDETLQWTKIAEQLRETKKEFGKDHPRGHRLTHKQIHSQQSQRMKQLIVDRRLPGFERSGGKRVSQRMSAESAQNNPNGTIERTGKAEKLKSGQDISRPIGGIRPVEN